MLLHLLATAAVRAGYLPRQRHVCLIGCLGGARAQAGRAGGAEAGAAAAAAPAPGAKFAEIKAREQTTKAAAPPAPEAAHAPAPEAAAPAPEVVAAEVSGSSSSSS